MNTRFLLKVAVILSFLILIHPGFIYCQNSDSTHIKSNDDIEIKHTSIIVKNIEHNIEVIFKDAEFIQEKEGTEIEILVNGDPKVLKLHKGKASFSQKFQKETDLIIEYQDYTYKTHVDPIPLWFSIIPPLVAILFALIFKVG